MRLLLAVSLCVLRAEDAVSLLKRECAGCHGDGQTLSKLDLRSREAMLLGGARGPALVPGKAGESLIYKAVTGQGVPRMPPAKALDRHQVEAIAKWIDAGASWVAAEGWGQYKDEDLWAFRPLKPRDKAKRIDSFLPAGAPADRRTLLRRVTFDLTGLPPTPGEIAAFLDDESREAWPRVIDRLLASPRYGERWGRHWLDVARYADTGGYSNDFERPNAWRYRDYVIRSFNQDKPYDRFIREQIAGDELYPGDAEATIATGFLRAGPWEHTGMSVEAVTRQMFLDDVTHSVAATFLGLTLGCARCHDHKFDPIPTRDYYRMQAVFATTEFARPKMPFLASENTADLEYGRKRLSRLAAQCDDAMKAIDGAITLGVMKRHGVTRPEDVPAGELKKALQTRKDLTPDDYENFKLFQKHSQLYRESLDRFEAKAFAVSSGPLDGETDGGPNLKYPKLAEYAPPVVRILPGGNVTAPGGAVEAGVLSLLGRYGGYPEVEVPRTVGGRRSALARWIADSRNPLTARVMVNRIWQYHCGQGLAADSNNFGKMGRKPEHPELLDWLADAFIESGWSVKAIHRLVLLSSAYQTANFAPRRVEAEVLRDSMLSVAGELSLEAGGPGVSAQINEDVARQPQHRMGSLAPAYRASPLKRLRNRRTIYTFQQRALADPMIEVFNGPSLDLSCERREASTVPTQAFALFNGQLARDMALGFAARLEREAATIERRIERAFLLAYGRPPSMEEAAATVAHWKRMAGVYGSKAAPGPEAEKPLVHKITSELTGETVLFTQQPAAEPYERNLHASEVSAETRALADVCLVLFNSNEFAYVY